jgi:peptidoglycan biosynthesis protein MviN/MurJ (putative lipid II flippase)
MLLLRVALANGAMIVTLLQLQKAATWWLAASLSQRVVWLAVSVAAGAGIYLRALGSTLLCCWYWDSGLRSFA